MAAKKDIIPGEKFGRLTVVEEVERVRMGSRMRRQVLALCECGSLKKYALEKLRAGHSKSCGCLTNHVRFHFGQRFGRLVFVSEGGRTAVGRRKMVARCDCGSVKEYDIYNITKGDTVSCGCFQREQSAFRGRERFLKHGLSETREYDSWYAAWRRCYDPENHNYPNYGGRGIKMCERWRESFENFLTDMGKRPEGTTLDRFPDVNGDYDIGNTRWATHLEQCNNKRNSQYVTRDGRTQTITEWAHELGIYDTLVFKRRKAGWPEERWFEPSQSRKIK